MEKALQWLLVLSTITNAISNSSLVSAEINERAVRKLSNIDFSGVVSIDCGVNEDYIDHTTNIKYQADTSFVQSGQIYNVSPKYSFDREPQIRKQLISLRSFPDGMRNCYTLKPKEGRNKNYLIRAYYTYGNYDYQNKVPVFDVHLGVNYWGTLELSGPGFVTRTEVIHITSTGTIDVCLVNTHQGVPFISLLELWPLDSSIYQTRSTLLPLDLMTRPNLGMLEQDIFIRYTDDIYGRSWFNKGINDSFAIKTAAAINLEGLDNPYKLPTGVLSTAVQALNRSCSLDIIHNYSTSHEYYVYLHFFDFKERADNQTRIMSITFGDDDALTQSVALSYWKPYSIVLYINRGEDVNTISIKSTSASDLPAMLNAYEIYKVLPQPNSATQQEDVDAIRDIKDKYKIPRTNWQGDPCGPINFRWEGLTCNGGDIPRIISLNLTSSKLVGDIVASFSNLTNLETLDLSNNELTGEVPKFLADLPNLKILNLARNNLTGSIPDVLIAKSNNPLQLSLDGNPGLNQIGSFKSNSQKSIVPLAASIAASAAVLIIVVIVSFMVWRLKRKNGRGMSRRSKKDGQLKSKNQAFPYSEVRSITNDFKTVIGQGGFGKVYLGTLQGGAQVAVKLLSFSSMQGYKEFQSEAKLLMIVHHRNLASLVGYCDEGDNKALIYEYMPNGNLQEQLSDKNPNVLKWNERLQIALDAAHGLDYLHNGCKPPIIHRDLKTTNILLNENMQAKISDFGLSRAFANDIDSHVSTRPAGTPGYVDPEFHRSGNLNKKSDVYSFGIVLLEIITGQPALRRTADHIRSLLRWVNLKLETGDIHAIVDPRLQGKYNIASAWRFMEIAVSCIPEAAIQRPDISHIVSELKECLSLEISLERTESNRIKSSNSLDMGSLMIKSDNGPYPR